MKTGFSAKVGLILLGLLLCLSFKVFAFSSELGLGMVGEVVGQVSTSAEEINRGTIIYGNLYSSIKTGDQSSLKIILPTGVTFGEDYQGSIVLEEDTEIIPNVYTTDTLVKDWWTEGEPEILKDKHIIYIIDLNSGKINTRLSRKCNRIIYSFQYVCGDYDALKNPRGGVIVQLRSGQIDFDLEVKEGKMIVTVNQGEVRVHNDTIDQDVTAGQSAEFKI